MRKEYDFSKMKVTRRGPLVDRKTGEPLPLKIRVSINLDGDVIAHFKALAAQPGALPYQTQINQALRRVMEGGGVGEPAAGYGVAGVAALGQALLADDKFMTAIAKRVRKR